MLCLIVRTAVTTAVLSMALAVPLAAQPFLAPPAPVAHKAKGKAARAAVIVGERYRSAHVITKPGRYGLANPRKGEVYGVIGTTVVRMNSETFQVLNILRHVEGLRD